MTETVTGHSGSTKRSAAGFRGRKNAPAGLTIERIFTTEGVHPYDEVTWERRDVVQQNWKTGETVFEQRGVEFPDYWSVNASTIVTTKYFRGAVGHDNREWSLKQLLDRVVKTYRKAGEELRLLRHPGRRRGVRARAHLDAAAPVLQLQLAGLVQRRDRVAAAGVGLLHPRRRRLDGLDPELVQGRGPDLQGRLRCRPEPVPDPLVQGAAAVLRRHRLRPGLLHARCGRLGRHDQVRRRHPARGQDGRAGRRPPGHRGVRRDQDARGGQDPRPARRRVRHGPRRPRHHLGAVPEREQLGPGHRRVHARGRGEGRLRAAGAARQLGDRDRRRPRAVRQDLARPRGPAPTRACSTTTPSTTGTPPRRRAGSPRPTRARSTCTWTTRPATWRR